MTLALALMASTAFAGNCPAPNEYAASAFKTIETGGDIASYLERYIVGRTAKNENCEDMYQVAIKTRNEKARKYLDRIGFGPQSEKDVKDNKYFEYAVRYGRIAVIEEMKSKLSENTISFYLSHYSGDWAGSGNTIEVIDWFIANQNIPADKFFISAIHSNSKFVIEQLIRRGADVRNENVLQAALRRVYKKPTELPVLELLIRAGAAVTPSIIQFASYDNAPAELEMIRLAGGHYTQKSLELATSRGNVEAMKYFLSLGLKLEDVPEGALHIAAKSGKLDAVKFVHGQLKNLDEINDRGFSALTYAESAEIIEYLIRNGADIDLFNTHGQTVLQQSVSYNSVVKIKSLLRAKASLSLRTREGIPLLHLVLNDLKNGNEDRVLQKVRLLVSAGADLNARDSEGYTVLMRAAKFEAPNSDSLLSLLVSLGANKKISVKIGRKRYTARDFYNENRAWGNKKKEILELLD